MFKRLILEDWQMLMPIVAFVLTFGVFLVLSIKAIFMGKTQSKHMANLPLAKDDGTQENNKDSDPN